MASTQWPVADVRELRHHGFRLHGIMLLWLFPVRITALLDIVHSGVSAMRMCACVCMCMPVRRYGCSAVSQLT